jgi:hypothetical protein
MKYITIDGDDVGQKIVCCYFNNDAESLANLTKSSSRPQGTVDPWP